MSNTTSPALPAFSYAQAAKGLAPSNIPSQNSVDPGSTASELAPKEQKSPPVEPAKFELTSKSTTGKTVRKLSQEVGEYVTEPRSSAEKDSAPVTRRSGSSSDETKVTTTSGASSPSFGAASTSTLPKEEDISFTPNGSSETWDKQSQVSNSAEKSTQTVDRNGVKDSDEDWEKVKVPNEKELKAAPIPAVNFWQARLEAQEAKAKATVVQRPSAAVGASAPKTKQQQSSSVARSLSGQEDEAKRKQAGKSVTSLDKDDANSKRRQGQVEASKPREDGRRASKQARPTEQDKDSAEPTAPPPVGDPESWPTPETALTEDKKRSLPQEKAEKSDSKTSSTKPHANKWVPVPYVPSARFVTPLPPAATRRGGRGGSSTTRGGREGGARGGNAPQNSLGGDKGDTIGSMGPPPLPKQAAETERGRDQEVGGAGTTSSTPTQVRRSTSAGGAPAEQRKVSGTSARERTSVDMSRKATTMETPKSTTDTPSEEPMMPNRARQDSKSFARTSNNPTPTVFRSGNLDASRHASFTSDSHSHPKFDPSHRRSIPGDFHKDSEMAGPRDRAGFSRDKEFPKARDYSKEKSESTRDKVDSWRDREIPSERSERREPRSERGRGSYRGRNLYSTYTPSSHAFTAPVSQQPFPPDKSHSYHGGHRQSSQPYPIMQSQSSQRTATRSQSIPINNMYSTMVNGMPGMHQPLSPIQTELPPFGYPPPLHSGVMSAIPYPAYDSYALLTMVTSQMEYYFSIDNLCKDMFLRQNMDSQGYVPLSVIAGFKRIKALTEDTDLLRHVCTQLKGIEYRPGDDGVDRLRRRDGWEQWIRPIDERVASAQNEGPGPIQHQVHAQTEYLSKLPDARYPMRDQATSPTWSGVPFSSEQAGKYQAPVLDSSNMALNSHITETPMTANMPELPSGDNFSLTNGNTSLQSQELVGTSNAEAEPTPDDDDLQDVPANGLTTSGPVNTENENVFPDEQIQELKVVVSKNDMLSVTTRPPFISSSSRTFSHGSIDGQTLCDEASVDTAGESYSPSLRGGAGSIEQLERGRGPQMMSPITQISPLSYQTDSLPIFWIKDGGPLVGLHDQGLAHERYPLLRERAFEQRKSGNTRTDMEVLYQFWSHFLVRNFNVSMYQEFHDMALEDAKENSDSGIAHLVRYYEALLMGQNPLSDRLARDLVSLAEIENTGGRPTYQKLRAAWRNGAFNLKSRKKVDKLLSTELKAELEK